MSQEYWGVYHLRPDGNRCRTPRVLCVSEDIATHEAQRFGGCEVARWTPPPPERQAPSEAQFDLFGDGT
ncbi:MAG: hypothetical protein ACO4AU_15535 [bacterium]|jgi:hypothetical protein